MVCNECFLNADHEGHEAAWYPYHLLAMTGSHSQVFFFYSNTEGCCDCGDESVWATAGFCTRHSVRHDLTPDHTPVQDLPAAMVPVAESVIHRYIP